MTGPELELKRFNPFWPSGASSSGLAVRYPLAPRLGFVCFLQSLPCLSCLSCLLRLSCQCREYHQSRRGPPREHFERVAVNHPSRNAALGWAVQNALLIHVDCFPPSSIKNCSSSAKNDLFECFRLRYNTIRTRDYLACPLVPPPRRGNMRSGSFRFYGT